MERSICNQPKNNGACLILKNCAQNRDDEQEENWPDIHKDFPETQMPPCVGERATFMASFPITKP